MAASSKKRGHETIDKRDCGRYLGIEGGVWSELHRDVESNAWHRAPRQKRKSWWRPECSNGVWSRRNDISWNRSPLFYIGSARNFAGDNIAASIPIWHFDHAFRGTRPCNQLLANFTCFQVALRWSWRMSQTPTRRWTDPHLKHSEVLLYGSIQVYPEMTQSNLFEI